MQNFVRPKDLDAPDRVLIGGQDSGARWNQLQILTRQICPSVVELGSSHVSEVA